MLGDSLTAWTNVSTCREAGKYSGYDDNGVELFAENCPTAISRGRSRVPPTRLRKCECTATVTALLV